MVIPYFGNLPNYFELWLESAKYNPDVNFLILTDDRTKYNYPANITLVYTTFDKIRQRIKEMYDFRIPLKSPYKLADFKVAYGDIFRTELEKYDFWGYCDVDLIFGNIRKFITDEILETYDKINIHGHLSLYRNNEDMRLLYKKEYKELLNYKIAFSTNWMYHFDEYPGMALIAKRADVNMTDVEEYADIDRFLYKFRKVYDHSQKENDPADIQQIFCWKSGVLTNIINTPDGVTEKELMYLHLQKRTMVYRKDLKEDGFYIVPNEFLPFRDDVLANIGKYSENKDYDAIEQFKKECFRQKFRFDYWKMKISMMHKNK